MRTGLSDVVARSDSLTPHQTSYSSDERSIIEKSRAHYESSSMSLTELSTTEGKRVMNIQKVFAGEASFARLRSS
jgi:hypothetical protein